MHDLAIEMHKSRISTGSDCRKIQRTKSGIACRDGQPRERTVLVTSRSGGNERRIAARWTLLVVGRARLDTFRLPAEGEVRIGRGPACEIRVDDPSVADEHALVRVGKAITLVDLGSGRSTSVANRALSPGGELALSPGVVFSIGTVTCVVQRASQSARLRPVRSHAYFEARVEDECARVAATGGSFGVARFLMRGGATARAEAAFVAAARAVDVIATYTPDELEALLLDVSPDEARSLATQMAARMRAEGAEVDEAVACFPADGRTPEAIFSLVTAALHGASKSDSVVPEGAMERLRPLVDRVANSDISVLVLGETGVGKEVMASTIHARSPRAKYRLLSINCAALSESLLDSELFGYERGAFTGAVNAKAGLLETAGGGTVFLDEIGEMPLSIQAKLLRVIEHKEVTRLGALTPRPIDVRFLAATNRDLEEEVERGTFRRDLYFRLAAFTIVIPPLRERVAEIEPLANAFISEASLAAGREPPAITADALAMLEAYSWPGNIRELRNVIDRAMLLAPGRLIEPAQLPVDKMRRSTPSARPVPPPTDTFGAGALDLRGSSPPPRFSGLVARVPVDRDATDGAERDAIIRALDACGGNQTKAAQLLGIARRTLINRIERYGLPRPKKA
jgi:two-component system, NtrC family, response regulator AtoC